METEQIATPSQPRPSGWRIWLACWLATTAVAAGGFIYSWNKLDVKKGKAPLDSLGNWAGGEYQRIISDGYDYDPKKQSDIAFLPAQPLAARFFTVFGFSPNVALLFVSNVCLLASFGLMAVYLRPEVRGRLLTAPGGASAAGGDAVAGPFSRKTLVYTLLAMGVWPTAYFFRVGYGESLLLFLSIATVVIIARGGPLWNAAVLAGLATAVRPSGLALLLPLGWEIWRDSDTSREAAKRMAILLPIACWGILAFMLYQWSKFGDPLAFCANEFDQWRTRPRATPPGDKFWALVTWEPIWGAYVPGAWASTPDPDPIPIPFLSMQLANPILWVGAVALTTIGGLKRWLSSHELLFAGAALAMPYLARGYEMSMSGQGRMTAVVFPIYIVLGQLLTRLPIIISAALLSISAVFMAAYAALFVAGYWVI